jgi:isopentenyl-diphosphate delta-isomerase
MNDKNYLYILPVMDGGELLEFTDSCDRPLLIAPRFAIRHFELPCRVVYVALFDAKRRLYIQRRGDKCAELPGYWDLSATGHVKAGEAREDAARRELAEEIGINATRLIRMAERGPGQDSPFFATLYRTGPTSDIPMPNAAEVADGLFLDHDEVRALLDYTPDLITPALRWAVENARIFRHVRDTTV